MPAWDRALGDSLGGVYPPRRRPAPKPANTVGQHRATLTALRRRGDNMAVQNRTTTPPRWIHRSFRERLAFAIGFALTRSRDLWTDEIRSGRGFELGTISLPSDATMRFARHDAGSASGFGRSGCDRQAEFRRPWSCRPPRLLALVEPSDDAHEPLGPDPHLKRVLLHVDPLDPEPRCMDKQAEKIADQLRSALEWAGQQRPDQGHHAGRPYLQRSHTQQPGQPSRVGLCAEPRNGSAREPKVYGQVGEL